MHESIILKRIYRRYTLHPYYIYGMHYLKGCRQWYCYGDACMCTPTSAPTPSVICIQFYIKSYLEMPLYVIPYYPCLCTVLHIWEYCHPCFILQFHCFAYSLQFLCSRLMINRALMHANSGTVYVIFISNL